MADDDYVRERDAKVRAIYAMRHPEHFKPWEEARPEGHTLSQAMFGLTLPDWRHGVAEFLADVDVGLNPDRWQTMWDHFWGHLLYRLRAGQLFMRGLELATGAEWRSEPRMFDDAEPDFNLNRITCFGRTFGSIRVYVTDEEAARVGPSRSTGFAGRPTSRPLLEAQMRARAVERTILPRLAAEVRYLLDWLKQQHPEADHPGQSAAENGLRNLFKELTKPLE